MDYEEPRRGRGRGRGRGRPRGRPRGSHRGLRVSKRNKIESDDEEDEVPPPPPVVEAPPSPTEEPSPPPPTKPAQFDQDCDISALEAPTFTTLDRKPPASMLQLSWKHPVTLIGEKVLSPRIHSCDTCNKPILIYGRMIPCKHVFCLGCVKRDERVCTRCGDKVARVEQTDLGTVFMCTYKINDQDCKRTYLSARDLQAHIDHRHKKSIGQPKEEVKEERISHRDPRGGDPRVPKEPFDHRNSYPSGQFSRPVGYPANPTSSGPQQQQQASVAATHHIPVMTSARTNLITVPLQDPPEHPPYNNPPHPGVQQLGPANPTQPTPRLTAPSHMSHHMGMPLTSGHPPFSSPPPFSNTPPQYTYPPTSLPPPQPPTGVPPPIYPSGMPPTTFGGRPPQYENQYPPSQWSTPPPQGPPSRPPPPARMPPQGPPPPRPPPPGPPARPPHHHPPAPPTSYYR